MIFTVVGARPQFVKAAVLSKKFQEHNIPEHIIHTGQHYDYKMNDIFFKELGLPGVAANLGVGSLQHGAQTAKMLEGIEQILLAQKDKIDYVLLYGDTNSTLAGALAASKLHLPIVHVEAGLRSFNRSMPEEINRVLTDHLSTYLFCSSDQGVQQLKKEGIEKGVHDVGDIMLDAVTLFTEVASTKYDLNTILDADLISNPYTLMTIHRPSNTDRPEKLQHILDAIGAIDEPVIWPVHPRNKKKIAQLNVPKNVKLMEPFSYFEMLVVLENAFKVITDSGGLQKEAYWKKKPCVTVRPQTEWVETLENNWNILAQPNKESINKAYQANVDPNSWKPLYGYGNCAEQIINVLKE